MGRKAAPGNAARLSRIGLNPAGPAGMMGHVRKPGYRCRSHSLSRRPQRQAARGRRGDRGAAPGAGRGRHRQDAGIDYQARPYRDVGARLAEPDPRRDLHQQGGARDARQGRRTDRRCGRRTVDRHLSRAGGTYPAAARGSGGTSPGLHHPRRRRSDPAGQVPRGSSRYRFESLAGAVPACRDRPFQEPRVGA